MAHFPTKKMALGCVCITWNAGLNFCQPAPSWAWGETWLYQKAVMETQVCDWWRYHLPPGRSSVRCLTNDLMRVFTSKRKWHESRADSGCNTSRIRWLTLGFYLYLQQIWAFLVCINAYFKQFCISEGGIINQILASGIHIVMIGVGTWLGWENPALFPQWIRSEGFWKLWLLLQIISLLGFQRECNAYSRNRSSGNIYLNVFHLACLFDLIK